VHLNLSYLIVVQGEVYRDVPLEGDGHCHEDGTRDGRLVQRVQEVGEQQDVDVRLKLSEKRRSRLMWLIRDRSIEIANISQMMAKTDDFYFVVFSKFVKFTVVITLCGFHCRCFCL